jgi:hypothetical protein
MARELMNNYHLKQQQVADLLGITQPAVSQYIREARGTKVRVMEKHKKLMDMIDDLASDLVNEDLKPKEFQQRVCDICRYIKNHKKLSGFY